MVKVLLDSPATKAIRRRMEEVRCDLDEDMQEIVEGARDMSQWRYYVRTFPWVCLGAALATGYMIVPRRPFGPQADAPTVEQLANQTLLATAHWPPKTNGRRTLLAFVGKLVMRGVSSYVGQQASKLFDTRATQSQSGDQP